MCRSFSPASFSFLHVLGACLRLDHNAARANYASCPKPCEAVRRDTVVRIVLGKFYFGRLLGELMDAAKAEGISEEQIPEVQGVSGVRYYLDALGRKGRPKYSGG